MPIAKQQLYQTLEEATRLLPRLDLSFRKKAGTTLIFIGATPVLAILEDSLAIKLQEDDRLALLQEPGAAPYQRPGEPAGKQYVILPDAISSNAEQLASWLEKSARFVSGFLPAGKRQKSSL